jgi:tetrapyrrole methylase family protein/MazG family protein/ATP diphosphatase
MLELSHEVAKGGDHDRLEDELGDLLFVYANLARHLKVDPEAALRRANAKFRRRFGYIEERLAAEGRKPEQSDLEEMDALWNAAKREERK